MNTIINQQNRVLTDIEKSSCQYPAIVRNNTGEMYTCWQEYLNGHDRLYGARLQDEKVEQAVLLSTGGEVLRPCMHIFEGIIWIVWAECQNHVWKILARYIDKGAYSNPILIEEGAAAFYQSVCNDGKSVVVLWTTQVQKGSQSMMVYLNQKGVSGKQVVSLARKAYRPTGCLGGDGKFYIAYDSFNGKGYDVLVRVQLNQGNWSEEIKVNNDEMWATQPVLTQYPDGVTAIWYDFGRQSKLSYVSADIRFHTALSVEKVTRFTKHVSWYQDMDAASNSNGISVVAYTWGKYNVHVRYKKPYGEWSDPVVMSNDDGHCAVHPRIIIDSKDVIHLVWQFANKNGHLDRNACTVYNTLTIAKFEEYTDLAGEQATDLFTTPIPAEKHFDKPTQAEKEDWLQRNGYTEQLLFGDIHGQSGISDGAGQIDQYFHFAKAVADLDFAALTDHDCYPDWTCQSEWEAIRSVNKLMNEEDNFASLLAYEWTPNEYKYDYGHKNIYYPGDDGEMFRSGEKEGMTPYQLFDSIKQYGGQCIPHHPAALWGLVSAATDWNFHDEKVQRLVEIFSRHAPYETFESTSVYTKNNKKGKGCCVQDALARSYRLGFTAGSDSHQMEHGIEGGIVAAFVPRLNRKDLFDAMYERFVYGTTGARILVSLKAGEYHMGQEGRLPKTEAVNLHISVLGTTALKVELVKNNHVIHTETSEKKLCEFNFSDLQRGDCDTYYLRVTQVDEHMAWSSPIWIEK